MIDDGYDWVVLEIQNQIQPFLEKQGITKLTNKDGRIFEKFFNSRRRMLRSILSPSMHYEMLGQIEIWTIDFIHSIKLGSKIDSTIFLANLITELSKVYESLKAPLETVNLEKIKHEPKIEPFVYGQGVGKSEDMKHLSSAIHYQFENNVWVIFVTFDEKHILSNQNRLLKVCGLHCCKPMYAMDYLRELSGQDPPLKYYESIKNKTRVQESFATIVGNLSED